MGLVPLFAALAIEPGTLGAAAPASGGGWSGTCKYRPTLAGNVCAADRAGRRRARGCWRSPTGRSSRRSCRAMLDPDAVPLRLRPAVALEGARPTSPTSATGSAVALRAGRVVQPDLRRQLELAGAGLVPGQLPDGRGPARVPPLLRRDPDRRAARADRAGWRRSSEAADEIARRLAAIFLRDPATGRRAGLRRRRVLPDRSPLARPTSRSTSTSTATTAPAWAPATRPAGRPWSPS